ncbi:MAG: protein kinase [Candidatus Sericytochromatia bacterium]|nr:protein kinase [Candidatus Sericytochromatia bacterium]
MIRPIKAVVRVVALAVLVHAGTARAEPGDGDPLGRALALEASGQAPEAIVLLEEQGADLKGTEGAALTLSAARMALRAGSAAEARRLANLAMPLAPDNGRVALEAARILRAAGDPTDALELASRAASEDPTVRFAAQELRFDILATLPRKPATPGAPVVGAVLAASLALLGARAWWGRPSDAVRHVPGTPIEAGRIVGDWLVERAISQSMHARIFRGRHLRTGDRVAIKQALIGGLPDDPAWSRFRQEMATLQAIGVDEPCIPPLIATLGSDIIINAWVEGETFEALAGTVSFEETLALGTSAARTLARLHARGIVHRDIKPANLMRERATGRPMLLDFGIARLAGGQGLTMDASLPMGTFGFMAPEQFASASQAGPSSDQYGLALTLYWLLTGHMPADPWLGPRTFQYVSADSFQPPRPPEGGPYGSEASHERIAALGAALGRAWQERPEDRFPDLNAFADALDRIRSIGPRPV